MKNKLKKNFFFSFIYVFILKSQILIFLQIDSFHHRFMLFYQQKQKIFFVQKQMPRKEKDQENYKGGEWIRPFCDPLQNPVQLINLIMQLNKSILLY